VFAVKRRILAAVTFIIVIFASHPLPAQVPAWQHTTIKDPLSGNVSERFVLVGEYLVSPLTIPAEISEVLNSRGIRPPEELPPQIVLTCAEGKVIEQYALSSQLSISPGIQAKLDYVIDGSRKKSVPVSMVTRANQSAFDLEKILPEILTGKLVTLVARIEVGTLTQISAPLRQILTEFRLPSPEPVQEACGDLKPQLLPKTPAVPVWVHTVIKDYLTDRLTDRFVLSGEYLSWPAPVPTVVPTNLPTGAVVLSAANNDPPKLLLECSEGRLSRHQGIGRGMPRSSTGIDGFLDMVMDGGKKKTVRTRLMANSSGVGDSLASTSFDIGNVLALLLRAKTVTLVARLDTSQPGALFSHQSQVLMEFQMPPDRPMLNVCSNDKLLRGLPQ